LPNGKGEKNSATGVFKNTVFNLAGAGQVDTKESLLSF
jgi:hypothetical protein